MIEFLRHATGMCGEPHPSLLTLLIGTPAVGYIIYKIRGYGKKTQVRSKKSDRL